MTTKSFHRFQTILSTTALAAMLLLSGCRGGGYGRFGPSGGLSPHPIPSMSVEQQTDDQRQVLSAQQNRDRYVEVTVNAPILKMLPEDTRGLPHEQFLLGLSNGTTVKVAHDTKLAPRVPLQQGDVVRIHGEYIWNERGGVIHWTHHSPNGRHEGGWIDFKGMRYE